MFNRETVKLLSAVVIVLNVVMLSAEGKPENYPDKLTGSIGAGVLISEKPYSGVDTEVYPIPMARLYYKNFFFEGTKLGYNLYGNDQWQFAPILQWRFDGYEASDSAALSGMADRDMTLDGGLQLTNINDWGVLTFSWVTDLLSEHEGNELEIGFSKRYAKAFDVEQLSIIPNLGVSFLSSNLADYYYGVRTSEVAVGRPAYGAGYSINYSAGVNMIYTLDEKWDILAGFNYTWFDDEIKDSPIVSEDGVYSIIAGAAYKF